MECKEKIKRCKYAIPNVTAKEMKYICVADGWDDDQIREIHKEDCEKCEQYKSRFIEYPLTIQGIENQKIETKGLGHKCGVLCEVRPCGKEFEGKTYLGFYLGDLPIGIVSSYDEKTGILSNRTMNNPAIFVPELKRIVYGMESWWREIKSIEDFKGISEDDIENVWYVKMLKGM